MENYNVKIKKIKRWNFIALILCAVEIVLSIFDLPVSLNRECKIFCVNEKIHTKKEVASVE